MHPTTGATTRHAALTVFLPALLLVAACGAPSAPELTDPVAILEAAATQASTAQSVRVDVTAEGRLALDLMGTGAGAQIDLADTTAALDLDIADGAAKATFALPGILGLRGELIAVDGAAFVKTSLTGPLYQQTTLGDADTPPGASTPDPSAIAEMVTELRDALAQPGIDPVKGDDVPCGTATCYTVTIQLTPAELAALGAGSGDLPIPSGLPIPIPDVADQTVDLTFRVAKDTTRLAGLSVGIGGGATGDLTAEITFSKWDEDLTIVAPPADQVQPAG